MMKSQSAQRNILQTQSSLAFQQLRRVILQLEVVRVMLDSLKRQERMLKIYYQVLEVISFDY